MGSTEAARRTGATQANKATATSNPVTPARITGSRELSVTHFAATLSTIRLSASPGRQPRADAHRGCGLNSINSVPASTMME
jgi:hypothetical protein